MRRTVFVGTAAAIQVQVTDPATPFNSLVSSMDLVQQEIKLAGRVTPGVYATIMKLTSMINDIIEPAILEGHATDQLLIMTVYREILECDAAYKRFTTGKLKHSEAALNIVKGEWGDCTGSVEHLKSKYSECLDHRDILVQHNNTVCCQEFAVCSDPTGYGACEYVKLDQGFVGCDYKKNTAQDCFADAKRLVEPLRGYFAKEDRRYEELRAQCQKFSAAVRAKMAECAYLAEAVNSKVADTNALGDEVNKAGLELQREARTACSDYKDCRTRTHQAYFDVIGPCEKNAYGAGGSCVKNREADRKNEWSSTQTIKCMLKHYCDGGSFKEDLLEQCQASISTYSLAITYPKLPELLPCEDAVCPTCPGCDECVDRPYYQYEVPCEGTPLAPEPVCTEEGECPEWCMAPDAQEWPGTYVDTHGNRIIISQSEAKVTAEMGEERVTGVVHGTKIEFGADGEHHLEGQFDGKVIKFEDGQEWTKWDASRGPLPTTTAAPTQSASRDLFDWSGDGFQGNASQVHESECTFSCSDSDCRENFVFTGKSEKADCWFLRKRCVCEPGCSYRGERLRIGETKMVGCDRASCTGPGEVAVERPPQPTCEADQILMQASPSNGCRASCACNWAGHAVASGTTFTDQQCNHVRCQSTGGHSTRMTVMRPPVVRCAAGAVMVPARPSNQCTARCACEFEGIRMEIGENRTDDHCNVATCFEGGQLGVVPAPLVRCPAGQQVVGATPQEGCEPRCLAGCLHKGMEMPFGSNVTDSRCNTIQCNNDGTVTALAAPMVQCPANGRLVGLTPGEGCAPRCVFGDECPDWVGSTNGRCDKGGAHFGSCYDPHRRQTTVQCLAHGLFDNYDCPADVPVKCRF